MGYFDTFIHAEHDIEAFLTINGYMGPLCRVSILPHE
jgi:hypothetical protein